MVKPQIGRLVSDISFESLGIKLSIPDPAGIFTQGLIFGLGVILQLAMGLAVLIWIVYAALGGLKIIRSQGNPDQIEEGTKKIRTILTSGAVLFVFFGVMALLGAIFGFGLPTDWGNTLAQCGGYSGPFYFAQVDQQRDYYLSKLNATVGNDVKAYCCVYKKSSNTTSDTKSPFNPTNIIKFGIQNDGGNWVLMPDGTSQPPASSGFSECVQFKG